MLVFKYEFITYEFIYGVEATNDMNSYVSVYNEFITYEFIYGARKDLIDLHWTELLYTWGLPQPRHHHRHHQKSTRTDPGDIPP
jgi:hypothetical protein